MADKAHVGQQINAMIQFINQEAREKAEEIRINAERTARNEQATFIHSEKLRLNKEYDVKRKDVELKRARQATKIKQEGQLKLLNDREKLKEDLRADAREALRRQTKSNNYENFLLDSAVEAALLIDETSVAFQCTPNDKDVLVKNLSEMQARFAKVAGARDSSQQNKKCQFSINSSSMLNAKEKIGGVVASALKNRIIVDNTLSARLNIAMHDLLPEISQVLFPTPQA